MRTRMRRMRRKEGRKEGRRKVMKVGGKKAREEGRMAEERK